MTNTQVTAGLASALRMLIGGHWNEAAGGKRIDVHNPATGDLLTSVPDGQREDVDRAVNEARRTFEAKAWRGIDVSKREQILWRVGELIAERKDELALLESLSNGKTVKEARGADIQPLADAFRYYAGWVRKLYGETIPVDGAFLNYTLREPIGVVGAIVPWNYPMLIAGWKLAPALAAGCSVVLKPSELTPITALKLGEICLEAGVPEGVVNVVTGYGPTAGEALARHNDVDKISFTGSVRTGRALMHAAADTNLKRLTLELGGKNPNIVFADADLDAALRRAFRGIFANKGEVCSAGSRLLLERSIYDGFVERLTAKARAMKVGDPLDPATEMGSQISQAQMERILGYIKAGTAEGAQLRCGGERDTEGAKRKGFFIKPTVFTGVKPEMKIAQEEIFGPVLSCIPFETPEEAAAIANGTEYGLVAAVWTRDIQRAHRMAAQIKAGSVWINTYNGFDSGSPFGGYKLSGFGRDLGAYALDQYTQTKSVWVALE